MNFRDFERSVCDETVFSVAPSRERAISPSNSRSCVLVLARGDHAVDTTIL